MENFDRLRKNLSQYLAKYYFNEFIKGGVLSLLIGLITWLFLVLIEYFGEFNKGPRAAMLFSFIALIVSLFVLQIFVPLAKYFGLLSRKSEEKAAQEIGRNISGVDDQLSNLISLSQSKSAESSSLLFASIDQRSKTLNQFDFRTAVDFRSNLFWLRFLVIPISIIIVLILWNPGILKDSSKRIISFNQEFLPEAPFQFIIKNPSLSVAEGESFELIVEVSGNKRPETVYLIKDSNRARMQKKNEGQFSFTFENVRKDIEFKLDGGGVNSEAYLIKTLPMPKILRNTAAIDYPAYTGIKDQTLLNQNQLRVPEGTNINWQFDTKNCDLISVNGDSMAPKNGAQFIYNKRVIDNHELSLIFKNTLNLMDSSSIQVFVTKDAYPEIFMDEILDTNNAGLRYFNGKITDDYGFSKLAFVAEIKENDAVIRTLKESFVIIKNTQEQGVNYLWNLDTLGLKPGQQIEYYFSVWDNDGINGAKQTQSQLWKYNLPSMDELAKKSSKESEKTKAVLNENQKDLSEMEQELQALKKDLLEKKKVDWEEKEKFESMLEKQRQMINEIQKRNKAQQIQNQKDNRFNEYPEELIEKQKQIEELFDKLFDDEFKEKYEEWQQLLEKMNKNEMLQKLEEMELDNEKLEKELDRTLELFKELELEQKIEALKNKAEELSKKQDLLREKTKEKKTPSESLKKEQNELENQLNQLKEDLKTLEKLNQDLEQPKSLPNLQKETDKAKEEMQKSSENLDKNNNNKAAENQQNAEEELDEIAQKLSDFQEQSAQNQHEENLEDMRQLLENLVDLSLAQESIMNDLKSTYQIDPQYVSLAKRQKDILSDTKVVEDSLLALSKRVPEISREINDGLSEIKQNMALALSNMTDQLPNQEQRYRAMAAEKQQYAMTALNDLANMFDEIMQQMQNQMMQNKQGNGQCSKPGQKPGSKPSAADMKKLQENLNKKIEEMKKAMEKGNKPNGQKPGQQGLGNSSGMSQSLAKMAAEQAAIREQLRQMSESLEKEGNTPGSTLRELENLMEKTEEDIVFQNITQSTIERQQEIMTKLLESEKAEREREIDQKRQSQSVQNTFDIPADLWKNYLDQKTQELEQYKTVPPNLKPYYKMRVNNYFSDPVSP